MITQEAKVYYIGTATALLEIGGLRLLTDPAFDPEDTTYTTPVYTLHKLKPPTVTTDQMGHINHVLPSHDHHLDNLDHQGMQLLTKVDSVITTTQGADRLNNQSPRPGDAPAPKGIHAIGLDNWQTIEIPAKGGRILTITGTPCRHGPAGSDRGPVTGFVLNFKGETTNAIYITGDTVYYEGVEEVARRFDIALMLLFIGAARIAAVGPAISAAKMTQPQDNPASDPRRSAPHGHPIDPARWLSTLPDDLPICNINIPGSHNAAAINTQRPTRWACQRHSITEQLQKGIRLLDIRLKPKKRRRSPTDYSIHPANRAPRRKADAPAYEFITCHGHLGPFGANEFQSLDSLLEECTSFLSANPRETIIMTIQVDDWRRAPKQDRPPILKALQASLTRLPLLRTPTMPTLRECRSRIFLINRINDDPALGVPINIPDNTPGATLEPSATRDYEVDVQDQYKKLNRRHPEAHLLHLTIEQRSIPIIASNYR